MKRVKKRVIKVGNVLIGGDNPISIQSMTNTQTKNIEKTVTQIKELERAGAQIVRLSVLDINDAFSLKKIVEKVTIPLIADIHFDYKLALISLDSGICGLRLNPGNIKERAKVSKIVEKASILDIPIRIGVNGGSLDRSKYRDSSALNMVKSAIDHIKILEDMNFYNIKVSLKSSDILTMIEANKIFSTERNYPLHLGVTEAGTLLSSSVRSSMGIGALLMQGIGDTIRVSVSGNPLDEIKVAKEILISLNLAEGIKWISCPTCGRTTVDVEKLTSMLMQEFSDVKKRIKVAVMGCVVNGPGEAQDADIALVGGVSHSLIYVNGKQCKKISNKDILTSMKKEIDKFSKK